ncbi:threonine synthase [Paenibacillus aurantius]|uniref:Threonine synthase n=1 Tax=Paenibacillus aurantius TaxID=2918900 RepID=A0AA96LDA8_9BACL|nr:threonine synthase [Paenibacillus aurantius]WNQ11059.1 threonine synthase [Paenibacillus aurantius]
MKARCTECGTRYSMDSIRYECRCGGLLELVQDFRGVDAEQLKREFAKRLGERHTPLASGVWRYKELIAPELPLEALVTKGEGNTGLYSPPAVTSYAGCRRLWLKALGENPSGSFKDHGMTAAVSHGRFLGFRRFACSSTGNTSSSLAMYAALMGGEAHVYVPEGTVSENKVLQTLAYGAVVHRFAGTYDDGIRFLREQAGELGLYVGNSVNPFRIEGQKSIIYETAQDLSWQLPDWIVLPGGALSNVSALGKGLRDLYELGFIPRLPRVAVVQAEGASPFHRMMEAGAAELVPEPAPSTRASALNIGHPPSWRKAALVLQETKGVTVAVTDEDILNAKAVVDASGVGCEPASAAAVAGLRRLVSHGIIDREETAVCLLTGHLLKDTDAVGAYHLGGGPEALYANKMNRVRL